MPPGRPNSTDLWAARRSHCCKRKGTPTQPTIGVGHVDAAYRLTFWTVPRARLTLPLSSQGSWPPCCFARARCKRTTPAWPHLHGLVLCAIAAAACAEALARAPSSPTSTHPADRWDWDGIGLELLDEPGYWEHCYWLLLSLVLSFALPQGFERLLPRARPRRPLPLLEGAKAANTADLRHVYQSCVLWRRGDPGRRDPSVEGLGGLLLRVDQGIFKGTTRSH